MHIHKLIVLTSMIFTWAGAFAQPLDNSSLAAFIKKNSEVEIAKREFETGAAHEARLSPLKREFTVDISLGGGSSKAYSYDADSMRLQVKLPSGVNLQHTMLFETPPYGDMAGLTFEQKRALVNANWDLRMRDYPMLEIVAGKTKSSDFVGENSFGVKKAVRRYAGEFLAIAPMNVSAEQLAQISVEFTVAPEAASALTKQLVWRFSGMTLLGVGPWARGFLYPEWAFKKVHGQRATLDNPTEWGLTWRAAPVTVSSFSLVNAISGDVYKTYTAQPGEVR